MQRTKSKFKALYLHRHRNSKRFHNLLVAIVRANNNIVIQNTFMTDLVREVWRSTGVIVGSKREQDFYDHPFQRDYDFEPRQMFRNNPRKFSLYIQNEQKA